MTLQIISMPKDFPKKYHDVLHTSTSFIHRFYLNILMSFLPFLYSWYIFIFKIVYVMIIVRFVFKIMKIISYPILSWFKIYEQYLKLLTVINHVRKTQIVNITKKYFFFCVINSFANFMRLSSASQGRKENCPFHNFFTTVLGAWKIIKVFVYRNR